MSVFTEDDGHAVGFFDGVCDVMGLTPCDQWQDDRPLSPSESRFSEPSRHQKRNRQTGKKGNDSLSSSETHPSLLSSSTSHSDDASAEHTTQGIGCTVPSFKAAAAEIRKGAFDPGCAMPSLGARDIVGPLVACARRRDNTKQFRLDQLQRQRIRELEQMNVALKSRVLELEKETTSGRQSKADEEPSSEDSAKMKVGEPQTKSHGSVLLEASKGPISHVFITKEALSMTERAKASKKRSKQVTKSIEPSTERHDLLHEMEDLKKIVESQRYVKQELEDLRLRFREVQSKNRLLESERDLLSASVASLESKHRTLQRKLEVTEKRHRTEAKLSDLIDRDNVTKAIILDLKHELHDLKCEIAVERIIKRRYKNELEASKALSGQLDCRAAEYQPILQSEEMRVQELRREQHRLRQEHVAIARKFQANVNSVANHYWNEETALRDEIEALESQIVTISQGLPPGSATVLQSLSAFEKKIASSNDLKVLLSNSSKGRPDNDSESEDELSMGPVFREAGREKSSENPCANTADDPASISDESGSIETGRPLEVCSSAGDSVAVFKDRAARDLFDGSPTAGMSFKEECQVDQPTFGLDPSSSCPPMDGEELKIDCSPKQTGDCLPASVDLVSAEPQNVRADLWNTKRQDEKNADNHNNACCAADVPSRGDDEIVVRSCDSTFNHDEEPVDSTGSIQLCDTTYSVYAVIEVGDLPELSIHESKKHSKDQCSATDKESGRSDGTSNDETDQNQSHVTDSDEMEDSEMKCYYDKEQGDCAAKEDPSGGDEDVLIIDDGDEQSLLQSENDGSVDMRTIPSIANKQDSGSTARLSDCSAAMKALSAAANTLLCSPNIDSEIPSTMSDDDPLKVPSVDSPDNDESSTSDQSSDNDIRDGCDDFRPTEENRQSLFNNDHELTSREAPEREDWSCEGDCSYKTKATHPSHPITSDAMIRSIDPLRYSVSFERNDSVLSSAGPTDDFEPNQRTDETLGTDKPSRCTADCLESPVPPCSSQREMSTGETPATTTCANMRSAKKAIGTSETLGATEDNVEFVEMPKQLDPQLEESQDIKSLEHCVTGGGVRIFEEADVKDCYSGGMNGDATHTTETSHGFQDRDFRQPYKNENNEPFLEEKYDLLPAQQKDLHEPFAEDSFKSSDDENEQDVNVDETGMGAHSFNEENKLFVSGEHWIEKLDESQNIKSRKHCVTGDGLQFRILEEVDIKDCGVNGDTTLTMETSHRLQDSDFREPNNNENYELFLEENYDLLSQQKEFHEPIAEFSLKSSYDENEQDVNVNETGMGAQSFNEDNKLLVSPRDHWIETAHLESTQNTGTMKLAEAVHAEDDTNEMASCDRSETVKIIENMADKIAEEEVIMEDLLCCHANSDAVADIESALKVEENEEIDINGPMLASCEVDRAVVGPEIEPSLPIEESLPVDMQIPEACLHQEETKIESTTATFSFINLADGDETTSGDKDVQVAEKEYQNAQSNAKEHPKSSSEAPISDSNIGNSASTSHNFEGETGIVDKSSGEVPLHPSSDEMFTPTETACSLFADETETTSHIAGNFAPTRDFVPTSDTIRQRDETDLDDRSFSLTRSVFVPKVHSSASDLICLDSYQEVGSQSSCLEPDLITTKALTNNYGHHWGPTNQWDNNTQTKEQIVTTNIWEASSGNIMNCASQSMDDLFEGFPVAEEGQLGQGSRNRIQSTERTHQVPSFFESTNSDPLDFLSAPIQMLWEVDRKPMYAKDDPNETTVYADGFLSKSYEQTGSDRSDRNESSCEIHDSSTMSKDCAQMDFDNGADVRPQMPPTEEVNGTTASSEETATTTHRELVMCSHNSSPNCCSDTTNHNSFDPNPTPSLEETTLGENPSHDDEVPYCGEVAESEIHHDTMMERSTVSEAVDSVDWYSNEDDGESVGSQRETTGGYFDSLHILEIDGRSSNTSDDEASLESLRRPAEKPVPFEDKNWLGNVVQGIASLWL